MNQLKNVQVKRELLDDFKKLILKLNELAPDIAELELLDNLRASRDVHKGLTEFEVDYFTPFLKKIRTLKSELFKDTARYKVSKKYFEKERLKTNKTQNNEQQK